jgi:hypothetical protein
MGYGFFDKDEIDLDTLEKIDGDVKTMMEKSS